MIRRTPAPLLVLAAIVSVQFGGALAATLIPVVGAAGSVTLRLLAGTIVMVAVARPRLADIGRAMCVDVLLYGLVLGVMNFCFYAALARLPIGVAVTIEFIGPLALATALSRRRADLLAVLAAALGVLLISGALTTPWADLDVAGLVLALTAGGCWAAYILLAGRVGAALPGLDGLALAMVVALVVVAPFGVVSGGSALWQVQPLWRGAVIGLLSSVLPYSLELLALRRMRPATFGVLLSLEPAVAAMAGLVVLGQHLHLVELVGMTLVVAASSVVLGRRQEQNVNQGAGREPMDEPGAHGGVGSPSAGADEAQTARPVARD